jgi:hypothetical protein
MTNYYSVFEKCKNPNCTQEFDKTDQSNYDDEGYCRFCSEIKSDLEKEGYIKLSEVIENLIIDIFEELKKREKQK